MAAHGYEVQMTDEAANSYNVLFLCTGNSARSIMAEAILREEGGERFTAHSAGSHPAGTVHPFALELLTTLGHDTGFARSKSWDEFAEPDAPEMDFIFTVCDEAAREECPVWPGHPATAHWGVPDPAVKMENPIEQRVLFDEAYGLLRNRIQAFISLPLDSVERMSLRHQLEKIGRDEI